MAGWLNNTRHTCTVIVWHSDDGGASYQLGATLRGACETSLAQLSDGRLMVLGNDCSVADGGPCPGDTLALAFSSDGGDSFTPWQCKRELVNTNSKASLLVMNVTGREVVLVSARTPVASQLLGTPSSMPFDHVALHIVSQPA